MTGIWCEWQRSSTRESCSRSEIQTTASGGNRAGSPLSFNRIFGHYEREDFALPLLFLFLAMFFSGSLLLEQIFTLDGLGLLSFQAVIQRDYPIILASLFIFSLMALIGQLLTDLSYVLIDRRISFEESQG